MADELGGRLAHLHLADGTGIPNRDEHLVSGRGTQPAHHCCGGCRRQLPGAVVLEVKTFRAATQEARQADLAEALEFADPTWPPRGRRRGRGPGRAASGGPVARPGPGQLTAGPVRCHRPAAEHQPLTTGPHTTGRTPPAAHHRPHTTGP